MFYLQVDEPKTQQELWLIQPVEGIPRKLYLVKIIYYEATYVIQ